MHQRLLLNQVDVSWTFVDTRIKLNPPLLFNGKVKQLHVKAIRNGFHPIVNSHTFSPEIINSTT